MKKIQLLLSIILCCLFLASCSFQENMGNNGQEEHSGYFDISVTTDQAFNVAEEKEIVMRGKFLGMQFYKGEAVQIWAEKKSSGSEYGSGGICIYKTDGSSELLMESFYRAGDITDWYIGGDGYYYIWSPVTFEKMDSSGKTIYEFSPKDREMGIRDICQLADGRIFLVISDGSTHSAKLAQMDADTGEITLINTVSGNDLSTILSGGIAAGPDGLMIMNSEGIWALNTEDGSKTEVLSFLGSSYQWSTFGTGIELEDFRVTEDGRVEILQTSRDDTGGKVGTVETLENVDVSKEKVPVTIRGFEFTKSAIGRWLKDRIAEFNKDNDSYYVVLQECEPGTSYSDFATQTSVEIATGKGPDILYGPILEDYISGMIEKGAFEDLAPYIEKSDIAKEDYFPSTFNCWCEGEKIYGVNFLIKLHNYHVSEAVLGTGEVPDVEALVDSLLAYREKAVYMEGYDSGEVLRHFLEGSETLWGMVNWESASCNFKGQLFAKLMETAKRYGDDEKNAYGALAARRYCEGFYAFESSANQKEACMVTSGVLFDEGCYSAVRTDWILAINSNSANKEAAWEFICELLGEEAQMEFDGVTMPLPVSRKAFEILAKADLPSGMTIRRNGVEVPKPGETELAEMRALIESARPLPIRTVPILDIICEEAEDFFDGTKSMEEVIAVIENRVGLYLQENQ